MEYQVEHPRWSVWRVNDAVLDRNIAGLYDPKFAPFFSGPPTSAFIADGLPVTVLSWDKIELNAEQTPALPSSRPYFSTPYLSAISLAPFRSGHHKRGSYHPSQLTNP